MPIVSSDIEYRLSGGSGNTNPNASLGGAKSSTEIVSATLHNLFDIVSSAESAAGDIEYRCFYVHNDHATLTLLNAAVFIQSNTPDTQTLLEMGLGTSAVNGTEQTVANENTAPAGVTFSTAAGSGNALAIGDIPAGQHKAVWLRRTIDAGASAYDNDGATLRVIGDTAA